LVVAVGLVGLAGQSIGAAVVSATLFGVAYNGVVARAEVVASRSSTSARPADWPPSTPH
jgi:hypothetical protein